MDDFENDELDDGQEGSSDNGLEDAYDDIKDGYDKYKERQKNKQNDKNGIEKSDVTNPQTDAKKFNDNLRSSNKAGSEVTKTGGKEVAKASGKEAAKAGGKEVAKEAGKVAGKAGAKAATEGALTASGVGAPVAAAIEVADQIASAAKKERQKRAEKKGVSEKDIKKEDRGKKALFLSMPFLIGFSILILILVLILMLFIQNEQMNTDLEELIKRREERNEKSLLLFNTNDDNDLLYKDYKKIEDDKKYSNGFTIFSKGDYEDPSYKTILDYIYSNQYDENLTSKDPINPANPGTIKDPNAPEGTSDQTGVALSNVRKYIKAERENFNKVIWKASEGKGAYSYVKEQRVNDVSEDKKPTYSGNVSINNIKAGRVPNNDNENENYQKLVNSELQIPDPKKYNTGNVMLYTEMLSPYLQKWFIPYSIMIEIQDEKFVNKYVLGEMFHKIDTTLYQINEEKKDTVINYYLKTQMYEERVIETYTIRYEDGQQTEKSVQKTDSVRIKKEESNTKANPVGQVGKSTTTSTSSTRTVETSPKIEIKEVTETTIKIFSELLPGPQIATDANGQPLIESINIIRDIYPQKYVPKVTYAQNFYDVTTTSYRVTPINESNPPILKEEGTLTHNGNSSTASITTTETWQEDITETGFKQEEYKVSYIKEKDYEKLGRKISIIEWYQDFGDLAELGNKVYLNEMYPTKTKDEKEEAYNKFGKGKGYIYENLNNAFYQIEKRYNEIYSNGGSTSTDLSNVPKNGFAWPIADIEKYPLCKFTTSNFGPRYLGGKVDEHKGIDISSGGDIKYEGNLQIGVNIIAAHDGKVIKSSNTQTVNGSLGNNSNYGMGNYVKIRTEDGNYQTVYMHLSRLSVKTGDTVKMGDIIGTMGTTGNSTGVHLHFQIEDGNGNKLDPLLYFNTKPAYVKTDDPKKNNGNYEYVSPKSGGSSIHIDGNYTSKQQAELQELAKKNEKMANIGLYTLQEDKDDDAKLMARIINEEIAPKNTPAYKTAATAHCYALKNRMGINGNMYDVLTAEGQFDMMPTDGSAAKRFNKEPPEWLYAMAKEMMKGSLEVPMGMSEKDAKEIKYWIGGYDKNDSWMFKNTQQVIGYKFGNSFHVFAKEGPADNKICINGTDGKLVLDEKRQSQPKYIYK